MNPEILHSGKLRYCKKGADQTVCIVRLCCNQVFSQQGPPKRVNLVRKTGKPPEKQQKNVL